VFYNRLNYLLEPAGVRQDHIFMNRVTDESGQVIGVNLSGSKIGGSVDGSTLIIPDPMAATGSSIASVLRMYRGNVEGTARRIVVVHLIITPEYIKRITDEFKEVQIYAIRLDRGLSTETALQNIPGHDTHGERGLNENHYIVPGGGGLGEVINNAWV
jgi:uracil phosphoribosyltransferase